MKRYEKRKRGEGEEERGGGNVWVAIGSVKENLINKKFLCLL